MSSAYSLYPTRHSFLPPSSDISMLPSGRIINPTGGPHTLRLSGDIIQPVRKSRGGPDGLPLRNGMNGIAYPTRFERFQEPWRARKAPSRYSAGNCFAASIATRSEEHTSELQSLRHLV